jgi:DNA-binding NarL/FixJ family response regulator
MDSTATAKDLDLLVQITSRERSVLKLIANGYSTKDIAHRLGIAFNTAVSHGTHLIAKLKIHDAASLTRFAIRSG